MQNYCIFFNPPNTYPSFSFRRWIIAIFKFFNEFFSILSVTRHSLFRICMIINWLYGISIRSIRHFSVTFP